MAFENVDVNSLKSALTSCKNSINYTKTNQLIGAISSPSIWQGQAQNNLKQALVKLRDVRYKELENKLNSYISVVSMIEQYKNLENQNVQYASEIKSLQTQMASASAQTYTVVGGDTLYAIAKKNNTTVDAIAQANNIQNVNNIHVGQVFTILGVSVNTVGMNAKIQSIQSKINQNQSQMETLKNKVANSI